MFLEWLQDQLDAGTAASDIANLVWKDRNNGCMPPLRNITQVIQHFESYHHSTFEGVKSQLIAAFTEYVNTLPEL